MNTAAYVVFILSMVLVSIVTPLIFSRGKFKPTWWDYVFPLTGIPAWFVARALGVGGEASMNNFLFEIFTILVVSITVPWLRFVLKFVNGRHIKYLLFILTLLPMTVAVCLRIIMPFIPE